MTKAKGKKSNIFWSWLRLVLIALLLTVLIRWLLFEIYLIPSTSMESTLKKGDFVVVSKLHYGARTPSTLLQIPLTHQHIWRTDLPSYIAYPQMPIGRLPSISRVKRGDIIIFNNPENTTIPIDQKDNYTKRCIALPKDTLLIADGEATVNNRTLKKPRAVKHHYFVTAQKAIRPETFIKNNITKVYEKDNRYIVSATKKDVAFLEKLHFVKSTTKRNKPKGKINKEVFPRHSSFAWNEDNLGTLLIPAKGMSLPMTRKNVLLYGDLIQDFDAKYSEYKVLSVDRQKAEIKADGKVLRSYEFQQDYFFVLGDNRHSSKDSRFWGFVPKDHVIGKATLVLFSSYSWKRFFIKL